MTIDPNIDIQLPESPDGDQPVHTTLSPHRVRVQIAGVTVDIELNPASAAAAHVPAPVATTPTEPVAPPAEPVVAAHHVRSPIVGTFYQSPEPGSPPFVSVGDSVTEGQQIGIVEAMKLMNRIDADVAGKVVAILVPDGTPVEYDLPLIALEPE
jgi:acetyl-CoA carboxylase biotin carboxyl carrier protein